MNQDHQGMITSETLITAQGKRAVILSDEQLVRIIFSLARVVGYLKVGDPEGFDSGDIQSTLDAYAQTLATILTMLNDPLRGKMIQKLHNMGISIQLVKMDEENPKKRKVPDGCH